MDFSRLRCRTSHRALDRCHAERQKGPTGFPTPAGRLWTGKRSTLRRQLPALQLPTVSSRKVYAQAAASYTDSTNLNPNYLFAEYCTPGNLLAQPAPIAIPRIRFKEKEFRFNNHGCSIGETGFLQTYNTFCPVHFVISTAEYSQRSFVDSSRKHRGINLCSRAKNRGAIDGQHSDRP